MAATAFEVFNESMLTRKVREAGYVYFLNNGDVSRFNFPLPGCLEDAIRSRLDSRKYGYSRPQGNSGVMKNIAQYERARGFTSVKRGNVCLTTGVTNGLHLVLSTLGLTGDVIVPTTSYPLVGEIVERSNAQLKLLATSRENNFLPTVSALDDALTDSVEAVILTSPNNPTGSEYSEEGMTQIYDLCREKNVYLIVDEIFSDLMLNGSVHPTPEYDVNEGTVIRVTGWSKDRGVAGFRLGYIAASEELVKRLGDDISVRFGNAPTVYNNFIRKDMRMRRYMLEPERTPTELTEELDEYSRVITANLRKYEGNEAMIRDALSGVSRVVDMSQTDGGFAKFVKVATNLDDIGLAQEIAYETGVQLVPGCAFNATESGWLRMTFSVSPQKLENGLTRLVDYLKR